MQRLWLILHSMPRLFDSKHADIYILYAYIINSPDTFLHSWHIHVMRNDFIHEYVSFFPLAPRTNILFSTLHMTCMATVQINFAYMLYVLCRTKSNLNIYCARPGKLSHNNSGLITAHTHLTQQTINDKTDQRPHTIFFIISWSFFLTH